MYKDPDYMKKWREANKDKVKKHHLKALAKLKEKYKGYCKCGCGKKVSGLNCITQKPVKYVRGHNSSKGTPHPRGKNHKSFKGGWISSQGYRAMTDYTTGKVIRGKLEHRIIAERILGRKFERCEHIHHIDGNKLNNNPNNLALMLATDHQLLHKTNKHYELEAIQIAGKK